MPIGPSRPLHLTKPESIDIRQAARYFGARGEADSALSLIHIFGCCMLFAAGLSWKYIVGAASALAAAMAVAFAFFSDKIGKGYQLSLIHI